MSNKQTSIEWLESTIKSILVDNVSAIRYKEMILALVSQAKAMHKEEIMEAYCTGCLHMAEDETIFPRETSERYYETTYGDPPPPKPHIPFIYR